MEGDEKGGETRASKKKKRKKPDSEQHEEKEETTEEKQDGIALFAPPCLLIPLLLPLHPQPQHPRHMLTLPLHIVPLPQHQPMRGCRTARD